MKPINFANRWQLVYSAEIAAVETVFYWYVKNILLPV